MVGITFAVLAAIAQSLQAVVNKKLSAVIPPRILLVPIFITAGIPTFNLQVQPVDKIF